MEPDRNLTSLEPPGNFLLEEKAADTAGISRGRKFVSLNSASKKLRELGELIYTFVINLLFSPRLLFSSEKSKELINMFLENNDLEKQQSRLDGTVSTLQATNNNPAPLIQADSSSQAIPIDKQVTTNKNLSEQMKRMIDLSVNPGLEKKAQGGKLTLEEVFLQTSDHAIIHGMKFLNEKQTSKPPEEQEWMIYYCEKDGKFEKKLEFLKIVAQRTGKNILTVNYRGVGQSRDPSAWHQISSKTLLTDATCAADYLINHGKIPQKNITTCGSSLGGAIAIEVASRYQQEGEHDSMSAVAINTFSTFSQATKKLTRLPISLLPPRLEMSPSTSLSKIKGKVTIIQHQHDGIVRKGARLAETVPKAERIHRIATNQSSRSMGDLSSPRILVVEVAEKPEKGRSAHNFCVLNHHSLSGIFLDRISGSSE